MYSAPTPPQIDLPEIVEGVIPRHRFMAAYEQKVEPPDKKWQYLLFAAEPYETIAFKVPCGCHVINLLFILGWEAYKLQGKYIKEWHLTE